MRSNATINGFGGRGRQAVKQYQIVLLEMPMDPSPGRMLRRCFCRYLEVVIFSRSENRIRFLSPACVPACLPLGLFVAAIVLPTTINEVKLHRRDGVEEESEKLELVLG